MSDENDLAAVKGKYREMILKKIRDAKLSDDLDKLSDALNLINEVYKACFGESLDENEEVKTAFAKKFMDLIQEALEC